MLFDPQYIYTLCANQRYYRVLLISQQSLNWNTNSHTGHSRKNQDFFSDGQRLNEAPLEYAAKAVPFVTY